MSRARSVPAFIVANSAPWMNGTARAKARNESVGKPGSSVAALRPPEFTASEQESGRSAAGRTRPAGAACATTRRRASCRPACERRSSRGPTPRLGLRSSSSAPSSVRPVLARKTSSRSARGAAGARRDPLRVERAHDVGEPDRRRQAHGERLGRRRAGSPKRSSTAAMPLALLRLGGHRLDASGGRSRPSAPPACPRRRSGRGR